MCKAFPRHMRTIAIVILAIGIWPFVARADRRRVAGSEDYAVLQQEEEVALIRSISSQYLRPEAGIDRVIMQQLMVPAGLNPAIVTHQIPKPLDVRGLKRDSRLGPFVILPAAIKLQQRLFNKYLSFTRSVVILNIATLSPVLTSAPRLLFVIHPENPSGPLRFKQEPYLASGRVKCEALSQATQRQIKSSAARVRRRITRVSKRAITFLAPTQYCQASGWMHWLQSRAPPVWRERIHDCERQVNGYTWWVLAVSMRSTPREARQVFLFS